MNQAVSRKIFYSFLAVIFASSLILGSFASASSKSQSAALIGKVPHVETSILVVAGPNHPGAKQGAILMNEDPAGTLTNLGKNMTMDLFNYPNLVTAINVLSLGNGTTAQAATDTSMPGEIGSICGLGRAAGTFSVNSISFGNWTIKNTFTSTCNNIGVNETGIYNSTSTSTLFGEGTFSTSTLYSGDTITISFYVWLT